MSEKIQINKLPVNTWNRLGVNYAEVEWEETAPAKQSITVKSGEAHEPFRLDFSEAGDSEVSFTAEENSSITVYELHRSNSAVKLSFDIGKNASVKLVQLLNPTEKLRHETFANCSKGGRFQIMTIMTGDGNIYSDNRTELEGDSSSINVEVAYLGKNSQTIDYNIAVNHWGKDTHSEINAAGALMDSAKKVFRGTIDFKTGSSDSKGSENETVIMLGDDVVNKTVPLILCSEENVEGSHGATIGELDDDTLFYFESRGIGREEAERIMAYAALKRLIRLSDDKEFAEQVQNALGIIDTDEE
ncbi:MAG: SufD family Fe-S cluster assembly protein [Oscillospiraceae bacterium]|nr:SufD family Fe-S cluster assembly protein [Oscillospiraceae bacterium]